MSIGARRLMAWVITLCLFTVLAVFLWNHRTWFEPHEIELRLANHSWAPLAFLSAHVLIGLAFVIPRTVMGIAAGLLFGLWWGLLWTVVGVMLGAWAAFGLMRVLRRERIGAGLVDRLAGMKRIEPWLKRLDQSGWRGVWAIRLLPMPYSPLNYAFGLASIGWRDFSIGTLLGTLPSVVIAVAVGAAGGSALSGSASDWILPLAFGIAGLAISLVIPKLPMLRMRPSGDRA